MTDYEKINRRFEKFFFNRVKKTIDFKEDGVTIDFDDLFTDPRNGDKLRHPGDPKASAGSVINCRCNMALKPKRDERGRLIPKSRISVIRNFNRPQRTVLI